MKSTPIWRKLRVRIGDLECALKDGWCHLLLSGWITVVNDCVRSFFIIELGTNSCSYLYVEGCM